MSSAFDLILVWAFFFFYCLRNFVGREGFDPSSDNHYTKGPSRVASIPTWRSAPVPAHVMVEVRCQMPRCCCTCTTGAVTLHAHVPYQALLLQTAQLFLKMLRRVIIQQCYHDIPHVRCSNLYAFIFRIFHTIR